MAQDEGRFGRINDPHRCWAPKGIRPGAPRQVVREYSYAYAAVCPDRGRMTCLILPYANTEMMNIFLREVSVDFADSFVLMLVDQAGWHRSNSLKVPENIRLIPQPAHSPELNPVEHVWQEVRKTSMANTAFTSLEQVERSVANGLVDLANQPERLRSLTNFNYLNVHC